jgi:hypothetical protein
MDPVQPGLPLDGTTPPRKPPPPTDAAHQCPAGGGNGSDGTGPLGGLRLAWRSTIEGDGGYCPVCERWGKIYSRPINKTMARGLLWLCGAPRDEDGWVNVPQGPQWLVRSNQLATLRWWGLVERCEPSDDPKKKHTGLWRVTAHGEAFALNRVEVPEYVYTYNGEVELFSRETVRIVDCFDDIFDYEEVMRASVPPDRRTT